MTNQKIVVDALNAMGQDAKIVPIGTSWRDDSSSRSWGGQPYTVTKVFVNGKRLSNSQFFKILKDND